MTTLGQITLRLDAMQRSLEEVREDVEFLKAEQDEGSFADDHVFDSYDRLWHELEDRLELPNGSIRLEDDWVLNQDTSGAICAEHLSEDVPFVYCTPGWEGIEGVAIQVTATHDSEKMAWFTVTLPELSVQLYKLIVQEILNSIMISYTDGISSFRP